MTTVAASLVPLVTKGPFRTSPVALHVDDDLTYDDWLQLGKDLARLGHASAFWVGDWAHHGQWTYGRYYDDAIALTGLEYSTVRNYASVCGRVPATSRRENLSFRHHAAVAPLTRGEQETWLERAEHEGWTSDQLRDELSRARDRPAVDPPAPPDEPAEPPAGTQELLPPPPTLAEQLAEIERELRGLADSDDIETAHGRADDLLCQALTLLGAQAIADAFDAIDKWYA